MVGNLVLIYCNYTVNRDDCPLVCEDHPLLNLDVIFDNVLKNFEFNVFSARLSSEKLIFLYSIFARRISQIHFFN